MLSKQKIIIASSVIVLMMSYSCSSENENVDDKYLEKVQTIDGIIETLYDVISGEIGEGRDWQLFEFLFHPEGKLIRYAPNKNGQYELKYMTPQEYINGSGEYLQKVGFYEKEIYHKIDTFGNIAHVLSTYESYHSKHDKKPFMRGINSFQLLNDKGRWWIINNYWTRETQQNPIPAKYLPAVNKVNEVIAEDN